jgi:hypothetical protein
MAILLKDKQIPMRKLAVVTGGTKGIGRAVVEKFAGSSFDVLFCARNEIDLQRLKENVQHKFGVNAYTVVADMSVVSSVKSFVSYVLGLNRAVDVLVNNAGYFVPGKVTEEPEGILEAMMNANLYSAYHTTRGLISSIKAASNGHIFNMCSIASIKAYPNGGSYAITKFALLGFSKVLREELKDSGVRVTAVLPGATRTASWDGSDLPDERLMKPEDIADVVYTAYTLSPRSVVEEILIRPQMGDV